MLFNITFIIDLINRFIGVFMFNKLFLILIKFYQKYLSPLKKPCCIFYPTCSNYAIEAYKKYGFFKATFLVIWRIIRCNPFNKGGIDLP